MIKPTEEMIQAQAVAFSARMGELLAVGGAFDMADPKRAGLAAVLAIVERDYEPRRCPLDGSATCFNRQDSDDDTDLADDECLRLEPDAECPAEGSPRCRSCVWRPAEDAS